MPAVPAAAAHTPLPMAALRWAPARSGGARCAHWANFSLHLAELMADPQALPHPRTATPQLASARGYLTQMKTLASGSNHCLSQLVGGPPATVFLTVALRLEGTDR